MPAACDVGARHELHERSIISQPPGAEALAQIGVEVQFLRREGADRRAEAQHHLSADALPEAWVLSLVYGSLFAKSDAAAMSSVGNTTPRHSWHTVTPAATLAAKLEQVSSEHDAGF